MISLQRIFGKYTGWLRRLKAVYVINNWLHSKQLRHNKERYRQQGLHRSIYAPIGHKNFTDTTTDLPWLDQPDGRERLQAHPCFQGASAEQQQAMLRFVDEGYLLLPGFFSPERVATLNEEVDRLLQQQSVAFNYSGRKIMDAHHDSPIINAFFRDAGLLSWLHFLLGKPVVAFQTINILRGSEQRANSDSIHMTTQPLGYMAAAWIALEDISPEQGPLVYYPGTHKLPYVTTEEYDAGNSRYLIGTQSNQHYEDHIEALIAEKKLVPRPFLAKAGDVFIWHANLLHGGSPILKEGATRRSMVAHYFGDEVICYHEMSQRPALLPTSEG